MEALVRETRYALRTLLASPGFTLVALLTLALGIGATTAIFSVVRSVLLEPLRFPEPDRLLWISESNPEAGYPEFGASPLNFRDFREQTEVFEDLTAFRYRSPSLSGVDGDPQRLVSQQVTAGYFNILRLDLELGRGFTAEEDQPGASPVVVLGHALWQERFGSDRDILGSAAILDGVPHTVVGVMPGGVLETVDVFRPLRMNYERYGRGSHFLGVVGRLRNGATLEQADTELAAVAARLAEAYPETNAGWTAFSQPWQERIVGSVRSTLWMLFAAVGAVLLICCANLANLLLVRLLSRERSLAIRVALGAGRGRLVREAFVESLVLALAGGAAGVLLAHWSTGILVSMAGRSLPRGQHVGIDLGVLGFALIASCLTALVFGLVPALHASRIDPQEALKEGGTRGSLGGGRGRWLRHGLIVSEVALALVLLVCAGLLARSFQRLQQVDLGFEPDRLLTAQLSLPRSGGRYDANEAKLAFYRQLEERMAAIPGVESATTIFPMPLAGGRWILDVFAYGRPIPPANEIPNADVRYVSPGYFRTMGIQLHQGRGFDEGDTLESERVVVLNTTAAERFFPGGEPLGQRLMFTDPSEADDTDWYRVVGVVDDVRHMNLDLDAGAEIYRTSRQRPRFEFALMLRGQSESLASLGQSLRETVTSLDPTLPIYRVKSMHEVIADNLGRTSFRTVLLGLFASLAVLLAAIGIYGVVSYTVSQSSRELGLRLALGAKRGSVLGLVTRRGMVPVLVGVGVGMMAALFAVRFVAELLYDIEPRDPVVFVAVPMVLLGVALLACLVPAWRATRVDPAVVLNEE